MDQEPDIPFWGSYKDHSPKDSFFENLITIASASANIEVFPLYKPGEYVEDLASHFENFLKGSLWNFKLRVENPLDTYNYFKYILKRFQMLKGSIFSENDEVIKHVLLIEPVKKDSDARNSSIYYLYERINEAIEILEDYVRQLTPSAVNNDEEQIGPRPRKTRLHGFRIKNKDILETAYNRLIFNRLISQDVRFSDFERAFTDWLPENKIIWLEGPGLLSYFIKSINGKGIEDEKKNKWIITINCFQDKNLNNFTVEQLRFAKKPTKTDDIDLVIKSINKYSGA
jgi:hypothetical protein